MDAQTTVADVAALAALVQSLALLELERPDSPGRRAGDQRAHRGEPLPGGARRDAGPPDRRRFRQAHRRRRPARRRPRRLPPLGGDARLRARAQARSGASGPPTAHRARLRRPTAAICETWSRASPAPTPPKCRWRPTRTSARPGGRPSVRPHPSGGRRRRSRRPPRRRRRRRTSRAGCTPSRASALGRGPGRRATGPRRAGSSGVLWPTNGCHAGAVASVASNVAQRRVWARAWGVSSVIGPLRFRSGTAPGMVAPAPSGRRHEPVRFASAENRALDRRELGLARDDRARLLERGLRVLQTVAGEHADHA